MAQGFARARCTSCGYDFLVAFSCEGRGACPSCNAKRLADLGDRAVGVCPHVANSPIRSRSHPTPGNLPFPATVGSTSPSPTARRERQAMDGFLADLRQGLHRLVKHPGLAFMAILAFALGIGSTTTMFCVTHGLSRDMPYDEVHRLAYVNMRPSPGDPYDEIRISVHELAEWRDRQSTLEGLGAFRDREFDLSGVEGQAERIAGAEVTANAFEMVRVQPLLGRGFLPEDEAPGAQPVVVLGHRIWSNRFREDTGVIGRAVRVDGAERTVVGVMPEDFRFPYDQHLWVPVEMNPGAVERGYGRVLLGFGRLRENVSMEEAEAEFAGLLRRLQMAYPESYQDLGTRVIPFQEHILEPRDLFVMNAMLVVVGFVLLIACANVANLLLARAASRSRELAVRTALGAGRGRVVGQLLMETLVISLAGGIAGAGLSWAGIRVVSRVAAEEIPYPWMDIRVDATVLAFAFGLVLLAALLAGTMPALKATGINVSEALKDEARGATSLRLGRWSRGLVVGELALSFALLAVSGLMVKGVLLITAEDLHFAHEDVLTARVALRPSDYPEPADGNAFYAQLVSRLEAHPGVRGAALTTALPGVSVISGSVFLEGQAFDDPREAPVTRMAMVSPGFFRTLGVRLVEGREFTDDDDAEGEGVAIVNQGFADRFFPGVSPLGRRINVEPFNPDAGWITIVGVAPDLAMNRRREASSDGVYVPFAQQVWSRAQLLVRARGDPLALTPVVRETMASLDPHVPLYRANTLAGEISSITLPSRVFAGLFLGFGLAALLLANVGLVGVMAFTVRRRTREIGIRMALGALSWNVLWLTLKGAVVQLGIGLILGVGLAALAALAMEGVLSPADPWDTTVYVVILTVLGATGIAASLVPAGRATRLDPVETLRYE